jgi:hypothetical protein
MRVSDLVEEEYLGIIAPVAAVSAGKLPQGVARLDGDPLHQHAVTRLRWSRTGLGGAGLVQQALSRQNRLSGAYKECGKGENQ